MADSFGIRILEENTRSLEEKLRRSINISNDDEGEVDDDSTLGDDPSLGGGSNRKNGGTNNVFDDPYDFLAKQHLDESSSDESSYWSNSDSDDSDDDDGGGDDDSDDDDDDSDSDASLQHDTNDDCASDGNVVEIKKEKNKRVKRSDSTLSIDAMIKLKMQMGAREAKASMGGAINKNEGGGKGARRRGRRLSQERQTLGSLARKIGSSTGNEISSDVKETISSLRRSESTNKLPIKQKRFAHIQQEGNPQKLETGSKQVDKTADPLSPGAAGAGMRRSTIAKYGDHAVNLVKPRDHYLRILRQEKVIAPLVSYDRLEDFLLPITAEDKAAFDMALVGAVRDQNLDKVQELQAQGHPLQARSQFGESILHVCARRGTPEMLRFMLQQEGVSARTCCDYGRTPLHDAAWSTDPVSLEMMKILIQECPDLLLILDKRGFMPLDYIPKERWPHACHFLDKYKDMIMPSGEIFGEDSSSEEEDSDDEEHSDEESDEE